jgi:hypothetical protein
VANNLATLEGKIVGGAPAPIRAILSFVSPSAALAAGIVGFGNGGGSGGGSGGGGEVRRGGARRNGGDEYEVPADEFLDEDDEFDPAPHFRSGIGRSDMPHSAGAAMGAAAEALRRQRRAGGGASFTGGTATGGRPGVPTDDDAPASSFAAAAAAAAAATGIDPRAGGQAAYGGGGGGGGGGAGYDPREPRVLAELVEEFRRAHAVAGALPPGQAAEEPPAWGDEGAA